MSLQLSDSDVIFEKILLNEGDRRNQIEHFNAFVAQCRVAFASRSTTTSLALAMHVAVDLLVTQRWYKLDVVAVDHSDVKACFVGKQKAVSAVTLSQTAFLFHPTL